MHPQHPMRDGFPPAWANGYAFHRDGRAWADIYVGDLTYRFMWVFRPGASFWISDASSSTPLRETSFATPEQLKAATGLVYQYGPGEPAPANIVQAKRLVIEKAPKRA